MSDNIRQKCETLGALISPCDRLNSVIDGHGIGRKKGVNLWDYVDIHTGETSRTIIGVKSEKYKNGLAFNCCPYCAVKFPYAEDEA